MIPLGRVLRLAWREIANNRLRASLLIVCVAAAVAAMAVVTQLGVSAERSVADDVLRSQGVAGTYAVRIDSDSPLPGLLAATTPAGIDCAAGRVVVLSGGTAVAPDSGSAPQGFNAVAVDPGIVAAMPAQMLYGRWLEDDDATLAIIPVVLPSNVASALWPEDAPADVLGKLIQLTYPDPTYLTVVGILDDGPLGRFTNGEAFVPLRPEGLPEPLAGWAGATADHADVSVYIAAGDQGQAPADVASSVLHGRLVRDGITSAETRVERVDGADDFDRSTKALAVVMRSVGIIVLIVGVLAVAAVSSASLRERAGELALRRAMGTTPRSLGVLVLVENLIVVFAGALLGLGILLTSSWAVTTWVIRDAQQSAVAHVDLSTAFTALAATGILGTLVALLPARRAARQNVMDVLSS